MAECPARGARRPATSLHRGERFLPPSGQQTDPTAQSLLRAAARPPESSTGPNCLPNCRPATPGRSILKLRGLRARFGRDSRTHVSGSIPLTQFTQFLELAAENGFVPYFFQMASPPRPAGLPAPAVRRPFAPFQPPRASIEWVILTKKYRLAKLMADQ